MAGNYYDEQFAGRINDIRKGGATPPTGGGGGKGGAGCVAPIIGIIIFAVIKGVSGSKPSYNYTPPKIEMPKIEPPPRIEFPQHDPLREWQEQQARQKALRDLNRDPVLRDEDIDRLLRELNKDRPPVDAPPRPDRPPGDGDR
jgi:hypothetical protein